MSDKKKTNHVNDFKVIRAAKGAGLGLMALRPFKKGDFIIEYTGIKKKNKDVENDTTKYLFDLDDKFTIDGSPRSNLARYINHSCVPNAETEIVRGKILISAIKNIAVGDEITYDYGKEYFNEFITAAVCRCPKHVKTS